MRSPFAEAERERLVCAMLPDVPFDGWTSRALRQGARRCGIAADEAAALFPRRAPDMVAAFSHWADCRMLERLEQAEAMPDSLSRRVALCGCVSRHIRPAVHRLAWSAQRGQFPRNTELKLLHCPTRRGS